MGALIFLALFLSFFFIRFVPPNTVLIVDRNTHYLKTKRKGFYFFNPSTDKVTTNISTYPRTNTYSDYFETHDGKMVRVAFQVTYHADNLEDVLVALESVRRSIDDIMLGSIYWAVNNFSLNDFINDSYQLLNEAKPKLLSEALELKIKIDDFKILHVGAVPYEMNVTPFKPHLSSHSLGPIKFN